MDKYQYPLELRKLTIQEQIAECQRMIYRNYVENLSFTVNNEKAKIKEVEYNNQTLKEKLDLLFEEWERLQNEPSQDSIFDKA